jgi:hypothetical protein
MSAIFGGDLSDDPNCETALDRIMAFAWSDALGAALWRLKWGYDATAFDRALFLLTDRCLNKQRRESRRWVQRLCEIVLREWLDDNCRTCGGLRFIMATGSSAKHVCTVCAGTGLLRPSDQARMREMGLSRHAYAKWERGTWDASGTKKPHETLDIRRLCTRIKSTCSRAAGRI